MVTAAGLPPVLRVLRMHPATPTRAIRRAAEDPQYTRPEVWHGHAVPRAALGHHANIEKYRRGTLAENTLRSAPTS